MLEPIKFDRKATPMRACGTTFLAITLVLAMAQVVSAEGAVELPTRKPGYWEIRMTTASLQHDPEILVHLCLDAATDKEANLAALSMTEGMCQKNELSRDGDAYVMISECAKGATKMVVRTVTSGDFQSSYTVKVTGSVVGIATAGGGEGPTLKSMTQTARWLADKCPEGVKPGDMQMPGGATVNTKQIFGKDGAGNAAPK